MSPRRRSRIGGGSIGSRQLDPPYLDKLVAAVPPGAAAFLITRRSVFKAKSPLPPVLGEEDAAVLIGVKVVFCNVVGLMGYYVAE